MKLIRIVEAPSQSPKKLQAIFQTDDGRVRKTLFGARGYDDYTIHKDKKRRDRYRLRHRKDLHTNDPTRAGYLSYYILWGDSTNLNKNISEYKRLFHL